MMFVMMISTIAKANYLSQILASFAKSANTPRMGNVNDTCKE